MIYTGIGSRKTTQDNLNDAYTFAIAMASVGNVLRSGKAGGMDSAFQRGVQDYCNTSDVINTYEDAFPLAEIYVPWQGFGAEGCHPLWDNVQGSNQEAVRIAESMHPAWHRCSQGARKLHTRNVCQILGATLDKPSDFVVFAAPEYRGQVQGGTATAVRLAREYNIPCFNLMTTNLSEVVEFANR